jgi:hypothetical protein
MSRLSPSTSDIHAARNSARESADEAGLGPVICDMLSENNLLRRWTPIRDFDATNVAANRVD